MGGGWFKFSFQALGAFLNSHFILGILKKYKWGKISFYHSPQMTISTAFRQQTAEPATASGK